MRKLRARSSNKRSVDFSNANCGPGTIMSALEKILMVAEGCELEEEPLASVKEEFDFLAEKLSFTQMQSMVVAMLIDSDIVLETGRMARYLGIKNIRMLRFVGEIEELVQRRIVSFKQDDFDSGYRITPQALSAFMKNEVFVPESKKNLGTRKLLNAVMTLIYDYRDSNLTEKQFFEEFEELMTANKRHILCKKTIKLDTREKLLFFVCLGKYADEGDLNIIDPDYMPLFSSSDQSYIRGIVVSRRSRLFKDNLLGDAVVDGFAPRDGIAVSEEIRDYIDKELGLSWKEPERDCREGLMTFENIKEKSLFYNSEDAASLDKLYDMLKQENFLGIQERMEECGMRSGFACLFYGAPGTGKTETVLQLARATGRDIMQVNIASIRSKWVGDSEKNIRNIFGRYRNYCSKCEVKPILLFNEADAIINKRTANVDRSVDKMENAIQNIILEELETLDGILIATTNLATNMDSAFERRFIYKVEFHKPDVATKTHIWKSMIGGLSDDDAAVLAGEFDLSGGQIENVMRKQFVDRILYNEQPTLDRLRKYCAMENVGACANSRPSVGFR